MKQKMETTILLRVWGLGLEGQGDLLSRLITPISHIETPMIPIINLLTKSHDAPS